MPDKRGEEEIWTICPLCAAAAGGSLVKNVARGSIHFDLTKAGSAQGLVRVRPSLVQNSQNLSGLETFCVLG
jgi:hypothetical protein